MQHADMQIIKDTLPALVKLRDAGKVSLCYGHPSSLPRFHMSTKHLPVPLMSRNVVMHPDAPGVGASDRSCMCRSDM